MLCVFTKPDTESLASSPSMKPVRIAGRRASIELGSALLIPQKSLSTPVRRSSSGATEPSSCDDLLEHLSSLKRLVGTSAEVEELAFGLGTLNGISYVNEPGISFINQEKSCLTSTIACYFRGDLEDPIHHGDEKAQSELDCRGVISSYRKAATLQSVREYNNSTSSEMKFDTKSSIAERRRQERMVDVALRTRLNKGSFVTVLYDSARGRIVAARDKLGQEPLFWVTGNDGKSLYFATDKLALPEEGRQAEEFPAGGIFLSHPGQLTGLLNGKPYIPGAGPEGSYLDLIQNASSRLRRPAQLRQRSSMELLDTKQPPSSTSRPRRSVSDIGSVTPLISRRASLLRELLTDELVTSLPSIMDISVPDYVKQDAQAKAPLRSRSRRLSALGMSLLEDSEQSFESARPQQAPTLYGAMRRMSGPIFQQSTASP